MGREGLRAEKQEANGPSTRPVPPDSADLGFEVTGGGVVSKSTTFPHIYDKKFVAAKEPNWPSLQDPRELPHLPGALNETRFYRQWAHKARISGLPLIPKQQFYVAWTLGDGNCYYSAIALIIYGHCEFWPYIKEQHLFWIDYVLSNTMHPRYPLYKRSFIATAAGQTQYNNLRKANSWTAESMWQVTADLYDIYLVIFTEPHGQNSPPPVKSRGCRNASHRFIRIINDNHYEAMRPNVSRPSEYQYPEITINSIRHTNPNFNDRKGKGKASVPFRADEAEVPEQLIPRPVLSQPSELHLAQVLGTQRLGMIFSTDLGYIPDRSRPKTATRMQQYSVARHAIYKEMELRVLRGEARSRKRLDGKNLIPKAGQDLIIWWLMDDDLARADRNGFPPEAGIFEFENGRHEAETGLATTRHGPDIIEPPRRNSQDESGSNLEEHFVADDKNYEKWTVAAKRAELKSRGMTGFWKLKSTQLTKLLIQDDKEHQKTKSATSKNSGKVRKSPRDRVKKVSEDATLQIYDDEIDSNNLHKMGKMRKPDTGASMRQHQDLDEEWGGDVEARRSICRPGIMRFAKLETEGKRPRLEDKDEDTEDPSQQEPPVKRGKSRFKLFSGFRSEPKSLAKMKPTPEEVLELKQELFWQRLSRKEGDCLTIPYEKILTEIRARNARGEPRQFPDPADITYQPLDELLAYYETLEHTDKLLSQK